jgi:spore coat polysaccharide biosynthesis protein SpsF
MNYTTEQEAFWAGKFGSDYIERNKGKKLLASNLNFFTKALNQSYKLDSCIEFGANIGMNLKALNLLFPHLELEGIEINKDAHEQLKEVVGETNAHNISIFDYKSSKQFDLSLIKGVLIHINPDKLNFVYEQLYKSSKKFILIAEYYNPSPVAITYRGHNDRLFKRDFAGEFLDKYDDVRIVDYGFAYHRDPSFPQDDITWFLLKKNSYGN